MSSFRQLMMRNKNVAVAIAPENVFLSTTKDSISLRDSSVNTFTKKYDGAAYGGFYYYEYDNQQWAIPILVSEERNSCFMRRNNSIDLLVSSTTFSYKGKNWYYSLNDYAIGYPSTTTDVNYNNSNGRYLISGGTIFTGQNVMIDAAKALLDYVYSFKFDDFTFVNYISATGSQWIETGLYASSTALNNYSIEVDCQFSNTSETAIAINNWAASAYFLMVYNNKCRWHGASGGSFDFGSVTTNTDYTIKIDIPNNKCYLNGTAYSYSRVGCGTAAIRLLGGYGTSGNYFKGKMYRTRFYDYTSPYNLVRDFVPAYCTTLSKYVFVDTVNNVFYENKGSGNFSGGN